MLLYDSVWSTWLPYFVISGLATFALSALLLALHRPLSLSLLVGPAFGLGLVWLVAQGEEPATSVDIAVLIGACVIGSLLAAWVIPYTRWVHRSFRGAELLQVDNDASA